MSNIEKTLRERGERYGEFADYANYNADLKRVIESCDGSKLDDIHLAALEMITSKIARILSGDPNHVDNWHDIAGYATLVEKELLK